MSDRELHGPTQHQLESYLAARRAGRFAVGQPVAGVDEATMRDLARQVDRLNRRLAGIMFLIIQPVRLDDGRLMDVKDHIKVTAYDAMRDAVANWRKEEDDPKTR